MAGAARGSGSHRKLSPGEMRRIRDGVDMEMAGYVAPVPIDIDGISYTSMPARSDTDPPDCLTARLVENLCKLMATDHLNLEVASQCIGIPYDVMEGYVKRGEEDIRAGHLTRMSWFTVLVSRVEGQAKRAMLAAVSANPLGWMNSSWRLERQWPYSFSLQRVTQKQDKATTLADDLAKVLTKAVENGGGAPLPRFDVESIQSDGKVVEEVVEEGGFFE